MRRYVDHRHNLADFGSFEYRLFAVENLDDFW